MSIRNSFVFLSVAALLVSACVASQSRPASRLFVAGAKPFAVVELYTSEG